MLLLCYSWCAHLHPTGRVIRVFAVVFAVVEVLAGVCFVAACQLSWHHLFTSSLDLLRGYNCGLSVVLLFRQRLGAGCLFGVAGGLSRASGC